MKVVHLSTYDSGGAANSAVRLHQGLLRAGIESSFVVLHKTRNEPGIFLHPSPESSLVQKILNRLGFPQTQQQKNQHVRRNKAILGEPFTSPVTGIDVLQHPLLKQADIINLHWVGDFVDIPDFFSRCDKPVVWTLHDMNAFMGGFHYKIDRDHHTSDLLEWDERYRMIRKKALENFDRLQIVAPSKWLVNESRSSDVLGRFPHHHIPYGLDTSVFKFYPGNELRSRFGWNDSDIVITFISDVLNLHRKGLDLLMEASGLLSGDSSFRFLAIGGYNNGIGQFQTVGRIDDPVELAKIYSQSDLVVVPSREDNLPNVMLEALACGTPVAGFRVGGLPDLLNDKGMGLMAEKINGESLADVMRYFSVHRDEFPRKSIREKFLNRYTLAHQAGAYLELYENMVKNRNSI